MNTSTLVDEGSWRREKHI